MRIIVICGMILLMGAASALPAGVEVGSAADAGRLHGIVSWCRDRITEGRPGSLVWCPCNSGRIAVAYSLQPVKTEELTNKCWSEAQRHGGCKELPKIISLEPRRDAPTTGTRPRLLGEN